VGLPAIAPEHWPASAFASPLALLVASAVVLVALVSLAANAALLAVAAVERAQRERRSVAVEVAYAGVRSLHHDEPPAVEQQAVAALDRSALERDLVDGGRGVRAVAEVDPEELRRRRTRPSRGSCMPASCLMFPFVVDDSRGQDHRISRM
jgi:hypothetical protein